MLKLVDRSSNRKTGAIAVTYRAGAAHAYATCPRSCAHNASGQGAAQVDYHYLRALRAAVPDGGQAWTYTHFDVRKIGLGGAGETVINASCEDPAAAAQLIADGYPAVLTVGRGASWPRTVDGVRFVRCPAETSDNVQCVNCGSGRPLCARPIGTDRRFAIVFTPHGSGAKRINSAERGGCYGDNGPVRLQWEAARLKTTDGAQLSDGARLVRWAKSRPAGSLIRHHITGDIGRAV